MCVEPLMQTCIKLRIVEKVFPIRVSVFQVTSRPEWKKERMFHFGASFPFHDFGTGGFQLAVRPCRE
jgi:hypothetical protein